jgi:hypothetical protein
MQGLAAMQALDFCGPPAGAGGGEVPLRLLFSLVDEKIRTFRQIIPNQYGTS